MLFTKRLRNLLNRMGLGIACYRKGDSERAKMHFLAASLRRTEDPLIYSYLGSVCHRLGDSNNALFFAEKTLQLNENDPKARFLRGTILAEMNKIQAAFEEFSELIKVAPQEVAVHIALGEIYSKLGKHVLALKSFTAAHDLDPSNYKVARYLEQYKME